MREDKALELGYPAPAMSVALSSILLEEGVSPLRVLDRFADNWGVAQFTVGDLRNVAPRLGLKMDSLDATGEFPEAPWHALVFSMDSAKIPKKDQTALRLVARVHTPPRRG